MDKLMSEWQATKADYALPNSDVDLGNLYYYACAFEELLADIMRENERLKAIADEAEPRYRL